MENLSEAKRNNYASAHLYGQQKVYLSESAGPMRVGDVLKTEFCYKLEWVDLTGRSCHDCSALAHESGHSLTSILPPGFLPIYKILRIQFAFGLKKN